MRQSDLFGKTVKESPKDEVSVNADLLYRAGYIEKLMAGVYSYLTMGMGVLNKVKEVVREEMGGIGDARFAAERALGENQSVGETEGYYVSIQGAG